MSTWRERLAPKIGAIITKARIDGLDERATMKALRNPYKGGWLAALWADERSKQLGRPTGRIAPRKGTRAAQRVAATKVGQLEIEVVKCSR